MNEFCTKCSAPFRDDDRFCGKCGAPRQAPADAAVPAPAVTQPAAPTKSGPKILNLLLGIAIPAIAISIFFLVDDCGGSVEGTMRVSGARGNFTFQPTGCASMQPYGRFGANLHGDQPNDGAVYLTRDPTRGDAVEIEIPGSCQNADGTNCTVFPVPRERCEAFELDIDFSGVTVNDVRQVEGHVRLQCALEDGTEVRGRIEFGGC
jgi:hypothetical protein